MTGSSRLHWPPEPPARLLAGRDRATLTGIWLASTVFYIATLSPSRAPAQFAGALAGPAGPPPASIRYLQGLFDVPDTGVPTLYGVLARAFALLPVPSRYGILSAVAAGGAMALLFGMLRRIDVSRQVAVPLTLAAAWSPAFWHLAATPGRGSVTALLLLAIASSLARWLRTRRDADFAAVSILFGLGVATDVVLVGLLPGILAVVAVAVPAARPRGSLLAGLVVVALGALLVQAIAVLQVLRASPLIEFREAAPPAAWHALAGALGESRRDAITSLMAWAARCGRLFSAGAGVLGLALAALGSGSLLGQGRSIVWIAAGVMGGLSAMTMAWPVMDESTALAPASLLSWVLIAAGIQWVSRTGRRRAPAFAGPALAGCLALVQGLELASYVPVAGPVSEAAVEAATRLPAGTVLVAGDARTDTHVLFGLLRRSRGDVLLVPSDPDDIERQVAAGRTVVASPAVRRSLERNGFYFRASGPWDREPDSRWSPLAGRDACVRVRGGWTAIDAAVLVPGGRMTATRAVLLYVATRRPWDRVAGDGSGPRPAIREFLTSSGTGRQDLERSLRRDRLDSFAFGPGLTVYRVEVPAAADGRSEIFRLPEAVEHGMGRAPGASHADVCPVLLGDALFHEGGPTVVRVEVDERATFLGSGWHAVERAGGQAYRWTAGAEAEILPTLARTGRIRVRIALMPALRDPGANAVGLTVNGVPQTRHPARPGPSMYEWTVEPPAWRTGGNRVVLRTEAPRSPADLGSGDDTRLLGSLVRSIELAVVDGARSETP